MSVSVCVNAWVHCRIVEYLHFSYCRDSSVNAWVHCKVTMCAIFNNWLLIVTAYCSIARKSCFMTICSSKLFWISYIYYTLSNDSFTPQTPSCLVFSAVWTEFATVPDSFLYIGDRTVLSCLRCERICELFPNDVTIGNHVNWVRTRQDSIHTTFRDWTKLFRSFQMPTVLTCLQFCSHRRHGQDKTKQSYLVHVRGVNEP